MRARTRTAALLFLVGVGAAIADPPTSVQPEPSPKERWTLEKFGVANPACREWTDGCAVCLRRDDGSFGCSLPGIACEPSSLTCRQMAQEPKPAGGSAPPQK